MTVTSERTGSLVVSKKENDIGFLGSLNRASQQETNGDDEFIHFSFSLLRKKRCLLTMIKPDQNDNQQQAVSLADKPVLISDPRSGLNLDKEITAGDSRVMTVQSEPGISGFNTVSPSER